MWEAEENKSLTQKMRRRFHDVEQDTAMEKEKEKMRRCVQILERMVNQNVFNDISLGKRFIFLGSKTIFISTDFKFYEDLSDEFKDKEGSLLPLWTFDFHSVSGLENTALCWNPAYSDLFAAGYGSCE